MSHGNQTNPYIAVVRAACRQLPCGEEISTRELLDLEPLKHVHGLTGALMRWAPTALADCARRGEPVARWMYGKVRTVRPWRWHNPLPPGEEPNPMPPLYDGRFSGLFAKDRDIAAKARRGNQYPW